MKETNLKDYLKLTENKKNITFVALEEVTDPRNIGSIIRSAASFNIDGLIVKERSFQVKANFYIKVQADVLNILIYSKFLI